MDELNKIKMIGSRTLIIPPPPVDTFLHGPRLEPSPERQFLLHVNVVCKDLFLFPTSIVITRRRPDAYLSISPDDGANTFEC